MAYLHCHTCDWEQDDFWDKRYNPITKLWRDFKEFGRPRFINIDLEGKGCKDVFSWRILWWEIKKEIKVVYGMKWWTYESFKKDRENAVCPKCGDQNFDID
ncbi:MAG: hypothetical protein ACOCQD_00765 [archaeon]